MRILIAGVGNLLRGDDGFGVRVAQRLAAASLPEHVHVSEVGISGLALVHSLMDRYDACIVADAIDRAAAPGTLYLLEPHIELPSETDAQQLQSELVDMHYAEPSRALLLAKALGVLPPKVFIVACQPAVIDALQQELSPAVERAVEEALAMIGRVVERLNATVTSGPEKESV